MNIRRNLKIWLLAATALAAQQALADDFTQAEQQQISIATPGLFSHSNAFTVDFSILGKSEYSFPLPVGKAKVVGGGEMEITTRKGDAVKAMFEGQVRLSRHTASHGNVIVVRHDNGLETVYCHNAQNLVKVGQNVKAGQTIAIVGGKEGKVFCTVAIMVNGGRINPETILDVNSHNLRRSTLLCTNKGNHVEVTSVGTKGGKKQNDIKDIDKDPFEKSNEYRMNLAHFNPGEWSYPLPGSKVISPYGGKRNHSGVDIKTVPNDKILAAFDGKVTMSGPYYGYGNCIVIKHANGLETLYSHQSKNLVKVGDNVKAGQVIGLTGRTGRATTEHLHFETKFMGKRFDPALIFDHLNKSLKQDMVVFTKNGKSVNIKSHKNYYAQGKK